MKRIFSIVMLMLFTAVIAVAQERTPMPYIYIEQGFDVWTVYAIGEGDVHLYNGFTEVENPYTIVLTDEEQNFLFGAYAKADGLLNSDWVELELCVPPLDDLIHPLPNLGLNVNVLDDRVILEPVIDQDGYSLMLIIDGINVDYPCVLSRGRADYVINAAVEAKQEGSEGFSGYYSSDIVIPAMEHFVPDVDGDGVVTITDVTAVIDYVLHSRGWNYDEIKADCDGDGWITIADVADIIDYILSNN